MDQRKPKARLSRPYQDQSSLWEAVGYSPIASPASVGASKLQFPGSAAPPPPRIDPPYHCSQSTTSPAQFPSIAELGMPSPSHHQQPSSPTDSDIPSRDGDQHTPTFHQPHYHEMDNRDMSDRHILEWDVDDVAGYIRSLGLDQYGDSFFGKPFHPFIPPRTSWDGLQWVARFRIQG